MENMYYPFYNEPLPYDYDALEPYIDAKTMMLHHDKHLQTYIDNLNALLLKNPTLQSFSLTELIINLSFFPWELQTPLQNNAGGVYNHRLYFELLSPSMEPLKEGPLQTALIESFGSVDSFLYTLQATALNTFGSGYAWLILSGEKLQIVSSPNQNTPLMPDIYPILNVDVWEHAYYLKHYNVRSAYLTDWMKVINWKQAELNYLSKQITNHLF